MRNLKDLVEEIKKELGIEEKVKIELKNYKRLIASTSLEKNIIRINRKILDKDFVEKKLGYENHEEFVMKVLKHELMHIKLKTRWHVPQYFEKLM